MGLASLPRFQLCAYLLSPGLQPTFIPWQRRWRPTLPSRGLCWRSIIAVTARDGATGLDADQKLCGKAPDRTQLRRGRGNPALVIRGAVHEARTAGMGCVCPANLARGPRYPRAVP